MSSKEKKPDRAVATTTGAMRTPVEMVETGTNTINSITASPALQNAQKVKDALALWSTENAALDANNKKKESLRQQLAQAEADGLPIARRWTLRRQGVLHEVNVVCDGSKEKVQAFNLSVVTRNATPPATVPVGLRQAKSKRPNTPVWSWKPTEGADGYLVQTATDPGNPATYAKPSMCTKARFELPGQTLGATIYLHVLALDPQLPGGQTEYSGWIAATVGA